MDELGEEERRLLFDRFGRRYAAGASVFEEGQVSDLCFLVQEGRVRLLKRVRNVERSLTVLKPGDLFGEDALLEGAARNASAVALIDTAVLALDRKTFGVLLSANPGVASRLVEQLVQRLRLAEEQVENAMLRDHPSRVVNTLLRYTEAHARGSEGHVVALSPLELASRAGLEVEVAKKTVQMLRDGGYLKVSGEQLSVPDVSALRHLLDALGMKEGLRDV